MRRELHSVDLRLLRVFCRVVECGGFSPAQLDLNVSQSTISTQIADLESRLGVRLCQRGRAGFRLTDNGREVYDLCQQIFRTLREFSNRVSELTGDLSGDLHIGIIDSLVTHPFFRLHQAIARLKDRGKSIHLHIHVTSPLELERGILDEKYHIGLGTFPDRVPGLSFHRVFSEKHELYCGSTHPLFERKGRDLTRQNVIDAEYVTRGYSKSRVLTRDNIHTINATAFNMEATAIMILSGKFIGHLPSHYAKYWVEQGQMRSLLPTQFRRTSKFDVVFRKNLMKGSVTDMFLHDLLTAFNASEAAD